MVNTKIRLIILIAAENGEALYSQQKQDLELTVVQIMSSLLSGLPFPSPMHERESEVTQSCQTLSDPMDCSLPGFSVHGIFQARVLEWGAIALEKRKN